MITRHMSMLNAFSSRVRLMVAVARPPVMVLLAMYAATGLAAAGGDVSSPLAMLPALITVAGFLIYSVSLNDIADVDIDRINLAHRSDRPLVTGAGGRRELTTTAAVGATVALGAACAIGVAAVAVCAAGLLVSAAYSVKPMRLSARGAVASFVLPACYVAVPYLIGAFSTTAPIDSAIWCCWVPCTSGSSAESCSKTSATCAVTPCSASEHSSVRHGRLATCRFATIGWIGAPRSPSSRCRCAARCRSACWRRTPLRWSL